jgi:ERCC4-type nuclease
MTIQIDSREKPKATELIKAAFDKAGVKWFVSKLPCGDYQSLDNAKFCIDRKQSLTEICSNICQDHVRFRDELLRAQEYGIKLIFLVEHGNSIKSLSDVRHWVNPRKTVSPYALDGPELYKRMVTIESKYNTRFHFCTKQDTGKWIIQLLTDNR